MTARRWIAIAVVTVMTAAGACSGSSPTGVQTTPEGPAVPPVGPTDTTGFVPPGGTMG